MSSATHDRLSSQGRRSIGTFFFYDGSAEQCFRCGVRGFSSFAMENVIVKQCGVHVVRMVLVLSEDVPM